MIELAVSTEIEVKPFQHEFYLQLDDHVGDSRRKRLPDALWWHRLSRSSQSDGRCAMEAAKATP
jgi:hypothetical protein